VPVAGRVALVRRDLLNSGGQGRDPEQGADCLR
jgi:hypothetical protein